MNLQYRDETPEDEPFIKRLTMEVLTHALAADAWPEPMRTTLLDTQYRVRRDGYRQSSNGAPGIIATVDGEPIGWLVETVSDEEAFIVNLAVLNAWRGRGVGTKMLLLALQRAGLRGVPVRLDVTRSNHMALALYRKLGFRDCGGDEVQLRMEWLPR